MEIAVIGAGASGLIACIELAKSGHKVYLIEKNERVGQKILATGNGRCNLSNSNIVLSNTNLKNCYNNFSAIKHVINNFDFDKLKKYFFEIGLDLYCDSEGRAYPITESSNSVLDVLRKQLDKYKVDVMVASHMKKVEVKNNRVSLTFNNTHLNVDKAIICVGANASRSNTYEYILDKKLYSEVAPSLAPIVTVPVYKSLNGLRQKCSVSLYKNGILFTQEYGEVLFKEFGLSGIVIFNMLALIRRDANAKYILSLDLFQTNETESITYLQHRLANLGDNPTDFFLGMLQNKLAEIVIKENNLTTINNDSITKIVKFMKNIQFKFIESKEFNFSQVVSGGIKLSELTNNFEVKTMPNIYCCGEVVNIDGICGGYNLHYAISSGYYVSHSIINEDKGE